MKKPAKPNNVTRLPTATGAIKGQTKRQSWTLREGQKTILTTPRKQLAMAIAETLLRDVKGVSLIDNKAGKSVARWVYGHRQR